MNRREASPHATRRSVPDQGDVDDGVATRRPRTSHVAAVERGSRDSQATRVRQPSVATPSDYEYEDKPTRSAQQSAVALAELGPRRSRLGGSSRVDETETRTGAFGTTAKPDSVTTFRAPKADSVTTFRAPSPRKAANEDITTFHPLLPPPVVACKSADDVFAPTMAFTAETLESESMAAAYYGQPNEVETRDRDALGRYLFDDVPPFALLSNRDAETASLPATALRPPTSETSEPSARSLRPRLVEIRQAIEERQRGSMRPAPEPTMRAQVHSYAPLDYVREPISSVVLASDAPSSNRAMPIGPLMPAPEMIVAARQTTQIMRRPNESSPFMLMLTAAVGMTVLAVVAFLVAFVPLERTSEREEPTNVATVQAPESSSSPTVRVAPSSAKPIVVSSGGLAVRPTPAPTPAPARSPIVAAKAKVERTEKVDRIEPPKHERVSKPASTSSASAKDKSVEEMLQELGDQQLRR